MKKTLSIAMGLSAVLLFFPLLSHAFLPVSTISSVNITVYGLYTTSDATCKTGWSAVLPFNKNATAQNFAASGGVQLGSGNISNPTNCILMIIKNSGVFTVASGSYTTTSNGQSDSACNAGLSGATEIFEGGPNWSTYQQSHPTATWPASTEAPTVDMAAAGVTQITTFTGSENGSEVVPIYLSVNSGCTGSATNDPASCSTIDSQGQVVGTNPPTSSGDQNNGFSTAAPASGQSRYKFVISMANALGPNGSGCGFAAAPAMKFVAF